MKKNSDIAKNDLFNELHSLRTEVGRLHDIEKQFDHLDRSLQFCEQKLKKIIDNIPDIFYILDESGLITYISDAVSQYGYSPHELIGKSMLDLVHPGDRKKGRFRVNERRTSARRTKSFELRLFTKERDIIPFEVKTQRIDYGPVFEVTAEGVYETEAEFRSHFLGTVGIARDITDRKIAEDEIRNYRQQLEEEVLSFRNLVNDLNKIGIALSSEHNLNKLLNMIVREVRIFTRSDGGSLYIKDNDELSFEVAQNDTFIRRFGNVPFKSRKLPIDHQSIAGYVASTGKIINIGDLNSVEEEFPFSLETMREFDRKMDYKSVSMLVVPMRNHKDEIIGVIQLINSLDPEGNPVAFDQELEELAVSLASQAAVAICNSRFIQDIKNLFESIVTYSAQAIDARSPHTAGHSNRVAQLVMRQAAAINAQTEGPFADITFTDEQLDELRIASFLHDIGKIGVREQVLDKVNKLTDEKIDVIKYRFAFIKRDVENRANIRKRTEELSEAQLNALDEETAKYMKELDDGLELILKLNLPRFYNDEEYEHLTETARKTYIDINGDEKPLLEPDELENLLVRKGNLTGKERKEIENHVNQTLKILEKIPFTDELKNVPAIAATHHEMLNGTGYPNKLTADKIPIQARMLAIADIFDALTAKDRPYKPPLPLNVTLKILREEAENGRLDKDLVDLFISEDTFSFMD